MIKESIKIKVIRTLFWSLCVAVVLTSALSMAGFRAGSLVRLPTVEELISKDMGANAMANTRQQFTLNNPDEQVVFYSRQQGKSPEKVVRNSDKHNKSFKSIDEDLNPNTSVNVLYNATIPRPKVTHIGFLKVHKAGSSTMQNMLFRFGLNNKLNVVTPSGHHYIYSKSNVLIPKDASHFDIFACHTIYSKQFYEEILPVNSVKIGIIREPLDRMMSAAFYYRDALKRFYMDVPKKNFIHNLVNHPDKYDKGPFSKTRNSMGKDFGFSKTTKISDTQYIEKYLKFLDQEFSLVLVTEQFEESLVMMRRLLNWSMADILFLASNSHNHTTTKLSKSEMKKFRTTNFLDYAIYDFFLEKFNEQVKQGGDDLASEVKYFKQVMVHFNSFCASGPALEAVFHVDRSKWDDSSEAKGSDCMFMKMKELTMLSNVRTMYKSGHDISLTAVL